MHDSFLQSAEWEQFQRSLGRKMWRVEGALVIKRELPYGFNYLYSPRPKLVNSNWLLGVEKIVKKEKSIFLKIDPAEELQTTNYKLQTANSIQPQKTTILDLTKPEDGLLAAMHEKTRYNVRLAEKKGVVVHRGDDFEYFWKLLQETAKRDEFHTHERHYYEKMLQIKSENFSNELFFAEYRGEVIAADIVNLYRVPAVSNLHAATPREAGVATYLHGASSRECKDVMAPHLLHWRIMQEAKKRGFARYDLWGIDDKKWPGLTRFKLGFGGTVIEYPQTVDVIYRNRLYTLYRLIKSHKF